MEYELSHAGVKGMKWGVRNNKHKTSGTSNRGKNKQNSEPTYTVKKTRRGAKVVARHNNAKVKLIVSNSTAVAAGALRVAAAFIPGAGALSGVANAAALVGTIANIPTK